MKHLKIINNITGHICDAGTFSDAAISATLQDFKYCEKTNRYEQRKIPIVYQVGDSAPSAKIKKDLSITSDFRQLFRLNIDTDEILDCGWVLPESLGSILKGFKLVTINNNTWYEKLHGKFVYEVS